jgi:hypothetical protein
MISVLIEKENFTLTEIGKIWGRSKSWVSRRLSLLTHLEPKMKNELKHGFLAPRLAQELARLPQGNDQERILKIVRRENMNKDDASQLVTWWLSANEDERRIVAEKGFNGGIKAINNNDSDILARAVAGHFLKIKDILDKLILIIQSRKILDWWPQDEYYSFKKLFLYLDQILLEELTSINGGAE